MNDFLQQTNMNTNKKALLLSSANKNREVTQTVEHTALKTRMMHSLYIVSFRMNSCFRVQSYLIN
jgi:hypothetical protein